VAKKRALILSPLAQAGLDLIYDPVLSAIVHHLELIRAHPAMGKALTGAFAGWRGTHVAMFRIVYRVKPDAIEVAYIRHCKPKTPKTPFRE